MTGEGPYRLTGLELAAGQVLGRAGRAELPPGSSASTPREALDAALLPALRHSPCCISFSGGRDSSAVLALAVAIARREGLPSPVPVTKRYPGAAESDEADWQEAVIRHLGLDDWVRIELDADAQHVIGPASWELVKRHGLLWPSHLHLQLPTLAAAAGGALVTGVGGDEILGGVRFARTAAVLSGRVRPEPRDVLRVGYAISPRVIRRVVQRREFRSFGEWLRPSPRRRAQAALAAQAAAEPVAFPERMRWWLGLPYIAVAERNMAYLAADQDVALFNPLLDRRFVGSVAALPPAQRFTSRTEAMRALFGDLLPEAILTRRSKASFDVIDAPERRQELVARWNGEGVDEAFVDLDVLRAEWLRPLSNPSTTPLLQSAWLALGGDESSAGDSPELVGHAG